MAPYGQGKKTIVEEGPADLDKSGGTQCVSTGCRFKKCLVPMGITLLPSIGGCLGAVYLRREHRFWYEKLRKPGWCAKHWCFFPTYNVLYPTMGFASYLVFKEKGFVGEGKKALLLYGAHLGLTWLWVPLLFKRRCFSVAFLDSLLVAGFSGATLYTFRRINDTAGTLFFPSFLWSVYIMITSFFIWRWNPASARNN